MKARELGFDVTKDTPELSAMLTRVKALEHAGYEFEAADGSLALLIRRALKRRADAVPGRRAITCRCARTAKPVGLRSDRQGPRRQRARPHRRRRRRPGERARRRAAGGARQVLSGSADASASPTTRSASSIRRCGTAARTRVLIESSDGTLELDDDRRQREHHRSQPAGAGRQPRVRAAQEGVHRRRGLMTEGRPPDASCRTSSISISCLVAAVASRALAVAATVRLKPAAADEAWLRRRQVRLQLPVASGFSRTRRRARGPAVPPAHGGQRPARRRRRDAGGGSARRRATRFRVAGVYEPTPDPRSSPPKRLEARLHLPDLDRARRRSRRSAVGRSR